MFSFLFVYFTFNILQVYDFIKTMIGFVLMWNGLRSFNAYVHVARSTVKVVRLPTFKALALHSTREKSTMTMYN